VIVLTAHQWVPQDLIDDLDALIQEEPDSYLNGRRVTLCMARDFLEAFFKAAQAREGAAE
jgi:hypothetical protein